MRVVERLLSRLVLVGAGSLALLLSACGGGAETDAVENSSVHLPQGQDTGAKQSPWLMDQWAEHEAAGLPLFFPMDLEREQLELARSARINRQTLEAAEKSAVSSQLLRKSSIDAFVDPVPVYRFFNTQTGAHFYTTNAAERDEVLATLAQFQFEGVAFQVNAGPHTGLLPVHRFFNTANGVHMYTISEAEKQHIEATLPSFRYEGVAYHASPVAGPGLKPLYRFFRENISWHFFSTSHAERDNIISNLCGYRFEGTGFHVLDPSAPDSAPPAPRNRLVLIVGDSLSQGYGQAIDGRTYGVVTPGRLWAETLDRTLRNATGRPCDRVVNVSLGAMTTEQGLSRLPDWLVRYSPTHVVLSLGTNDVWRRYPLTVVRSNIEVMAAASRAVASRVHIMEFSFLRSGAGVERDASAMYQQAAANSASVYFNGTAGVPYSATFYHPDWVHLRDAAQPIIHDRAWQSLQPGL